MKRITMLGTVVLVLLSAPSDSGAQEPAALPATGADTMPMLRLEAGGPTSFVSSVTFNPRGTTLYAAGWDKVVRAWAWDAVARRFELDSAATYRVPVGPGLEGVINAIAVSPDGTVLAVAGRGMVRGASDLRHPGWKVPAAGTMTPTMRQDQGTIYLFDTRTRDVRQLRGHTAPVVALAFAPAEAGKAPLLISAGQEWDQKGRRFAGSVRAWDCERGAYVGGVSLPDINTRPSIAAWHTGRALEQARVAIAWGDAGQSLRIWDIRSNALRTFPDGQYNNTAAWWGDGGRLITGSTGKLKLWNTSTGDAVVERELPLPRLDVPRAVALFSSAEQGRVDRAAIVIKSGDGGSAVRMRIVDLTTFRLVNTPEVALWEGAGILPSIAGSAGGAHLAIAGNPAHEIATVAVNDVLSGRSAPALLRGAGISARAIGFARNNGTLGIIVSRQAKAAPGGAFPANTRDDLVFDPANRRIVERNAAWKIVQPQAGGWRLEVGTATDGQRPGQQTITIRDGQRTVRQIRLPVGRRLTDCALLPPRPPLGVPIVAVATHELGQPLLEIYDASSGAVVRELSGHVAAVDCVAFSDDGALLATCAGDRTVSVWNLADLDQVIGARGSIPGVAFDERAGALVVADIAADSPYRSGPLAAGDAIVGIGAKEPVGSLVDFYLRVSRFKPGETIAIRRQRANRNAEAVQLVVGQGTDERKPLLSLFVIGGEPWNWIGWSPLGPYESSGDAIEQMLGWHFNTGLANHPARFALAGEYRHLRREGLIDHLLRERALPADKSKPLDRPEMSIRLRQPGQEAVTADGRRPLRLYGREAELDLEIRGIATEAIEAVTWQAGDGEPKRMEPSSRQVWTARLTDLPSERRAVEVRLTIATNETEPQSFAEHVALAYRPAAPTIDDVQPANELTIVGEATYALRARVRSREGATTGLKIDVAHMAGDKEIMTRHFAPEGEATIDARLQLEPGDNTITIIATNAGAEHGAEALERTVLARRIAYNPESVPPPELSVTAVVPDTLARHALASDRSEPLVVDSPTLKLEGSIAARKALVRAEWDADGKTRQLTGFAKNVADKFDVHETVALQPGLQRIRCTAQATGSLPTEVGLSVEYRPRLPQLFLTAPQANAEFVEVRDPSTIQVTGRMEPTSDKNPFDAVVLLNGQPQDAAPVVDREANTFSAEVTLSRGDNRIEAQLSNAWGARATSDAVLVRYVRPPRIVELTVPQVVDAPLVELTFIVETPTALPLSGLQVNGWELPAGAAVVEHEGPDVTAWKVTARDVPLREGLNEIRPLARNADGWSVIGKTAQVQVMLPPPPKALVEIVSPQIDRTVESPQLEVRYVVRSSSRLKRVELRNDEKRVAEIDVSRQIQDVEPGAAGKSPTFRIEATARVKLQPRDNRLRIVAVNDGGESQAERTITYVRKPIELAIDRLQSPRSPKDVLEPELVEGGQLHFAEEAADGNLLLHGHVRWPDVATQRENPVKVVQVWVNGFLQRPVPLETDHPADLDWPWRARIRLNRGRDNAVSVRLPGVAREADGRLDFKVGCRKPDDRQRLHLLVVGIGEKDTEQLEALALRAVRGRRVADDRITTPAFSQGWIYLISGYVNRGRVTAQLERIHLRVGDATDAGSDVVMVYYRGQESVDKRGQFHLLTSQSQWDKDLLASAISGRDLSERFNSIPGAQLFLLDVQRQVPAGGPMVDAPSIAATWPSDPQMAALRYSWVSTEAIPADARLLVAFDNAVPHATRLGEIESEVALSSQRSRQKYGTTLRYEQKVPEALRDLVLAGPPPEVE